MSARSGRESSGPRNRRHCESSESRPLAGGLRQWQVAQAWQVLADACDEPSPEVIEMFRPLLDRQRRRRRR